MYLKKFLGLFAGALLAGSLAAASSQAQERPDAERLATARTLLEVSGTKAALQRTLEETLADLVSEAGADKGGAGETEAQLRKVLLDSPNMKAYVIELRDTLTQFYAEKLTVAEMREVIAFYQTPAGKKFQGLTPEVMQRVAPVMTKIASEMAEVAKGLSGDGPDGSTSPDAKDDSDDNDQPDAPDDDPDDNDRSEVKRFPND